MSFLYRTQPALRCLARPSSRLFTSTAIQNKSATEAVKETVKGVDRVVSDAAVTGIEKGRKYYPLPEAEASQRSPSTFDDACFHPPPPSGTDAPYIHSLFLPHV
jgi:hypothetical protein